MNKYFFQDIVIGNEGLLKGPFGSDLKRSLYVPKGENAYKVYLQENILNETLDAGEHYISKEYFETKMYRYAVKENDFIVTCDGTLGEIYQLKDIKEKGLISSSLLRITLNPSLVDYNYFYYLFKALIKKELTTQANNSVLKHLPGIEVIRKHPVCLPELEKQRLVGRILKSIDNKIRNNKKIEIELESMAMTLYDYWFMQFEFPNEVGKPYKSMGGKMVWCDELNKEIPEGWEARQIGDILIIADKSKIQVNGAKEKGEFPFFTSGKSILAYHEYFVDGFNVFLNTGGNPDIKAYKGKCAYSTDTWCISAKQYSYILYHYLLKLMPQFEQLFFAGSGLKHLQKDALKSKYILLPDNKVLEAFNESCSSIWGRITNCLIQNLELSSLRDFLLPLLMNSQVTFK